MTEAPVINADGTPKWRMAPSARGAYWKGGMKLGYQDVGLWTLLKCARRGKVKVGRLYGQFRTSKTVTLKKSLASLHLIRQSDIRRDAMTQHVSKATSGEATAQIAIDGSARDMDSIMEHLEKSGVQGDCGPKTNEPKDPQHWRQRAVNGGYTASQRAPKKI